jgi:tetratricopeptide (TPR) repeat protein
MVFNITAGEEPNASEGVDKGLFTGMLNTVTSGSYGSGERIENLIPEGEQKYEMGLYKEAIEIYNKILDRDPDSVTGWLGLAKAQSASGFYENALNSVHELLFRDPENWHGYLLQGAVFSSLSRNSEAVEAYQKALDINETDPYTWAGYGAALCGIGSYDLARDACRKSQELNGSLPSAYYWEGLAASRQDENDYALSRMNTTISLDPSFIEAYVITSEIREKNRDISTALDIISEGLIKNKESFRLWTRKGELLEKLARNDEAILAYTEALRLNPENTIVRERLEKLTGEAG